MILSLNILRMGIKKSGGISLSLSHVRILNDDIKNPKLHRLFILKITLNQYVPILIDFR